MSFAADHFPEIPTVLTAEELWKFLQVRMGETRAISTAIGDHRIPPLGIVCHECKKPWSVRDSHDVVVRDEDQTIPLTAFVGSTLGEVRRGFAGLTDAVYCVRPECKIRSDRFIDLTPDPKYPALVKNKKGWVGRDEGITDDYVIQEGDEAGFQLWKYFHRACNRRALEQEMRKKFEALFSRAGFERVVSVAIPNQYCPCEQCAPWLEIVTEVGKITIGWRKRVINIDWSALGVDLSRHFRSEDVTKGPNFIHAWGPDKAVEYLRRLRETISVEAV